MRSTFSQLILHVQPFCGKFYLTNTQNFAKKSKKKKHVQPFCGNFYSTNTQNFAKKSKKKKSQLIFWGVPSPKIFFCDRVLKIYDLYILSPKYGSINPFTQKDMTSQSQNFGSF
ncbi:hypothetical protein PPERSA_03817 [Pseudocohnilembus persalinus]|uniref:Uncharacterized protein n=1 Tax=Pseudocohnilembus persalinus TaxID=266149 RepID=A0A0V0QV95_PSEPJ|nr:hypothetical protein PPERSA_03817 [Pseudocohnilembus persalinus]|eukprot:KRX05880.1 hypothetical protein PPERSA_03817 [Pseudocohnilembus persalinus]